MTETTENFDKLIFRGIETIYLISSNFVGILCVQGTTLKVLFKVINEHLLPLLESGFSGFKAKMVPRYQIGSFSAVF